MELALKSSSTFNFVSKTLDNLTVYFSDESKRNSESITKGLNQISILWDKKVTLLTTFHEKGKVLVLVIQLFYTITPTWKQICNQILQNICTKYIPETFDLLPQNQWHDKEMLCEVQNILLQLTSLCSIIDLPQKYQKTLVAIILERSFDQKYFLHTCPNKWMEDLVDFICIQFKILVRKVSQDPNDFETIDWLRFLNTKLIDLSKAFPHEAFRGTKYVMQTLVSVYKMMNCGLNDQIIQTNAVTSCLAVLEQIYLNKELGMCVSDIKEESPSTLVLLLAEIVNIFSRKSSKTIIIDNFLEVEIFEILFEATINQNTADFSALVSLAQCLALYTFNEIAYHNLISRLFEALMSENVNEAYWSLNVWIIIARMCTKESCYIYFEYFAQMFLVCKNERQKFFLGKTMKAFFECLKSSIKTKIQEKYPPELNINLWIQLGMHNINEPQIVEKLFNLAETSIRDFLDGNNIEVYEEMCQFLKLCSTNPKFIPEDSFFELLKKITEFLIDNSSHLRVFGQLINCTMHVCLVYIKNICDTTICNILSIIKENNDNPNLSRSFIRKILSTGVTLDKTLSENLKTLLLEISKDSRLTDIEKKLLKIGYSIESNHHICYRVNSDTDDDFDDDDENEQEGSNEEEESYEEDDEEETYSPRKKKRKFDSKSDNNDSYAENQKDKK